MMLRLVKKILPLREASSSRQPQAASFLTQDETVACKTQSVSFLAPDEAVTCQPQAASFLAPDEAVGGQPQAVSFFTPDEIVNPEPWSKTAARVCFEQGFDLGDALRLARSEECPLFNTFFDARGIDQEYQQRAKNRKDSYADRNEKFYFEGFWPYSDQQAHELDLTAPLINVKRKTREWWQSESKLISSLIADGPPIYLLFNTKSSGADGSSIFWFPRTPQLSFGTRQFLNQLSNQLQICLRSHEKCRSTISVSPIRPKRLLKIDIGNEKCFVILTDRQVEYAALSYSWGTTQSMLTAATLAELQAGVHPSYFSQSIQDAIKVIAGLGFKYLWVDALCILQDNYEDVAEEIQKMGDTYQGASFTIAASNSTTNRESFLRGRPQDAYSVSLLDENRSKMNLMMIPDPRVFQRRLIHPLHARGWTLQEAYFSRRYLHFGLSSVTMVCPTITVDFSGNSRTLETIFRHEITSSLLNRAIEVWRLVVENYSSRRLTKSSDKLVAISAIAKDIANSMKDPRPENYLAGLWRHHLTYDLLWQMEDTPQPRPSYRAPSWSWASVDGKVGLVSGGTIGCSSNWLVILDAMTSWDTLAGPFSSVTAGFVIVRSKIRATSDYFVTSNFHIEFLGMSGRLDAIEPDISPARDGKPCIWVLKGEECAGEYSTGRSYGDSEYQVDGIGLILLETPDQQSFRRIGLFSFSASEHDSGFRAYFEIWNTSTTRTVEIF